MATNEARVTPQVTPFDEAAFLKNDEDAAAYVQACLDETPPDGRLVAHALGVVARARNAMSRIAETTGLSRESLYKALSGKRDPGLTTILKVAKALELPIRVGTPAGVPQAQAAREQVRASHGFPHHSVMMVLDPFPAHLPFHMGQSTFVGGTVSPEDDMFLDVRSINAGVVGELQGVYFTVGIDHPSRRVLGGTSHLKLAQANTFVEASVLTEEQIVIGRGRFDA